MAKETPQEAFKAGIKAATDGDNVQSCPYRSGSYERDASDDAKMIAYLRDCWFSGYHGETTIPKLPKGVTIKALA